MALKPQTRRRLPVQLMIVLGVALLTYHSAADWFATRNHNSELSGYVDVVEDMGPEVVEEKLAFARDYNERMPQGPLRDPYAYPDSNAEEETAAYESYQRLLEAAPSGVMGRLVYKSAGINLPIFHGTSEKSLRSGAGHLYGSSLPIGGSGTHSALTSHSGLVNAKLFTDLPAKAKIGDEFSVTVLGLENWYKVDQILTVRPDQGEELRIVPGEDYVTLITCTPIGVNSHRLLVRGTAISGPVKTEPAKQAIGGDGVSAGFPWWVVWFVGGVGFSVIIFLPAKRKQTSDSSLDQNEDSAPMKDDTTTRMLAAMG